MRRCIPWWFYLLAVAATLVTYSLGTALKPRKLVTVIFQAYERDGKAVHNLVFILNTHNKPVRVPLGGVPLTRPVGHEQIIAVGGSENTSHAINIPVRWRTRDEYIQWLENDFLTENNLDPEQWKTVINRLKAFARENKQHYPIILPDRSDEFWKK